jgi:hypothetical protein
MIWCQNRGRDRPGPSKTTLGIDRLARELAGDAEVIQRVGDVRMERAEAGLLQTGYLAQQLFG